MTAATSDIPDSEPPNITARVLAPLALVACLLTLFLLVSGTLSGDDGGSSVDRGSRERARTEQPRNRPEITGGSYVVQPGDTLSGIASRADIPLARLERRNPDIDPATLNAGQKINLR